MDHDLHQDTILAAFRLSWPGARAGHAPQPAATDCLGWPVRLSVPGPAKDGTPRAKLTGQPLD